MKLLQVVDGDATPDQINAALRVNTKNVVRWSTPVTIPSTAVGSTVSVQHDLGAVPNSIEVEPFIDCRWWVDQDDRAAWNATVIQFHTSHVGLFIVRAGVQ